MKCVFRKRILSFLKAFLNNQQNYFRRVSLTNFGNRKKNSVNLCKFVAGMVLACVSF